MVIIQTYLFDQDEIIIMQWRFSLLVFINIGIIHRMVGWYAKYVWIKALLKVTRGSIVIRKLCEYVLMDKRIKYQETNGHKMMRLIRRYETDLNTTGGWGYWNGREFLSHVMRDCNVVGF